MQRITRREYEPIALAGHSATRHRAVHRSLWWLQSWKHSLWLNTLNCAIVVVSREPQRQPRSLVLQTRKGSDIEHVNYPAWSTGIVRIFGSNTHHEQITSFPHIYPVGRTPQRKWLARCMVHSIYFKAACILHEKSEKILLGIDRS